MHHTTDKGDIGVAVVSADLIKKGLDVLHPISSTSPFDLVIHKNGTFRKVQVKYREEKKGGVKIGLTRAIIGGGKITKRKLRPDEVDIFAIYCPATNECYYIRRSDIPSAVELFLRIRPTKKKQTKGIRWASEYLNPVL